MKKLIIMTEDKLERLIQERMETIALETTKSYERDLLTKQANIAVLQSQINPHFLYNTLECIRGQALLDGAEDIAETTRALSRFFRYSISGKSDIVSIRDELENVKNYVLIQQYRFKDRFQLQIDVEESNPILDGMLPKLSLQPVMENAIIHGFSNITEGGLIHIQVHKSNENAVIQISDNGTGIAPDKLEELNRKMRKTTGYLNQDEQETTGIGIQNVDRRLKLLFGNEYGISINSCPGVGTDVELFLPYMSTVT